MKQNFRNFEAYALVTGAASGMGRIYSLRLAERGYNVILVDIADDPNKEMIVRFSKYAVQTKLGADNSPEKEADKAKK